MLNRELAQLRQRMRIWARGRGRASMRSRYDTSDVLQEATLQLWLELRAGRREVDEYSAPLLKTIAGGHDAKLAQHNQAQCRSVTRQEQLAVVPPSPQRAPEHEVIDRESTARLVHALTTLDEFDREILDRRFVKEQSFKSIAAGMGIPEHTVRRQCQAAIDRLGRVISTA